MQQVIEGMMSVFFLIIVVFVGIEIAGAMTTASEAQAFKIEVMERLEDCNFDSEVIKACFQEAKSHGFSMTLRLYYSDGRIQTLKSGGIRERSGCYITSGKVAITYPFEIPFLKVTKKLDTTGIIL